MSRPVLEARAKLGVGAGATRGCGPLNSSQQQALRLSPMKEEGSTEVLIPILSYLLIPLNVSQISEPVFINAKNFKVSSNKMRLFVCL